MLKRYALHNTNVVYVEYLTMTINRLLQPSMYL